MNVFVCFVCLKLLLFTFRTESANKSHKREKRRKKTSKSNCQLIIITITHKKVIKCSNRCVPRSSKFIINNYNKQNDNK